MIEKVTAEVCDFLIRDMRGGCVRHLSSAELVAFQIKAEVAVAAAGRHCKAAAELAWKTNRRDLFASFVEIATLLNRVSGDQE